MRGVFTAAAALGLGPTRALDMLEKMGGSALAQSATAKGFRAVHMVLGNGGVSRMTQVIPVPFTVKTPNANFALDSAAKYASANLPNGNDLFQRIVGGQTLFANKPWTAFVAGVSNAHSRFSAFAQNPTNIVNGLQLFSAGTVLQQAQAALVPMVSVSGIAPALAPSPAGAASAAQVASATAFTGLFSSAASQLMTRLSPMQNQALFSQYYTAFLGLAQWGDKATYTRAKSDAKVSLGLVVKNLAAQLQPAAGQASMWVNGSTLVATQAEFRNMTESLIVTMKAMSLGLCSTVIIEGIRDDPHGQFAKSAAQYMEEADVLGAMFNSFLVESGKLNEPGSSAKLGDRVVITVSGDTMKNSANRSGWPDNNPHNTLWVQGQGLTKPGWIGGATPTARINWNPATGAQDAAQPTANCTSAAVLATLYAISGGNKDAVRQFSNQEFSGAVIANLLGT
jgi:hypothetical protein